MGRITKIEGKFMGVPFEVKPTPLNIEEVQEEVNNMLKDWYKENEPEAYKIINSDNAEEILSYEEEKDASELSEILKSLSAWKKDKEFSADYIKTMANHCMEFKRDLDDSVWSKPNIEYSTVREAWDFFCGRQAVPSSGRSLY